MRGSFSPPFAMGFNTLPASKAMRYFILIILLAGCSLGQVLAQPQPGGVTISAGVSLNPWLMAVYNEYELGPVVSASAPIYKNWEVGLGAISRKVLYVASDRSYGYKKNITYPHNRENVYFVQLGYLITRRRWVHAFHALPGLRHEKYEEKLVNDELGIDETYALSEKNAMLALAYTLKYRLRPDQQLALRWMLPVNRSPFDDVNRYSLELAYQFVLSKKKR